MRCVLGFLIILSLSIFSQEEEIIVIAERGWVFTPSVDNLSEEDISEINAHHFKELLNLSSGTWISRGSGQESLISIRSPVLTGSGACGSFLIIEDEIPIRPLGFCNVNNLFEVSGNLSSEIQVIKGSSSSVFGGNALHGLIKLKSITFEGQNSIGFEIDKNNSLRSKFINRKNNILAFGLELDSDKGFRKGSGYDQQKFVLKTENRYNDWSMESLISITNLNQETAGYIDSYEHPRRLENQNLEAYRDANSIRLNTKFSKQFDEVTLTLNPYVRKSSMEFIQHYLPGKPIEKNGQQSLGLFFKILGHEIKKNTFNFGAQFEAADINLDEFQPNKLTTSSAFNNAVRPKGFHYNFEVLTSLVAVFLNHNYKLNDEISFFSDLRIESLNYNYDNLMNDGRLRDDGTSCGFGGCFYSRPSDTDLNFLDNSYRFGVERKLINGSLFFQLSTGHRPPQINELFRLQKGQTLADLDSEEMDSLEIAFINEGETFRNQIVFYYSKKNNYIFKDASSNMILGGRSRHRGLELKGSKFLNSKFSLKYAFNLTEHLYDFTNSSIGIYSGNDIDTSPNLFGSVFFNYELNEQINFQIEQEFMDEYYTEPSNLYIYKGHNLTNVRSSYEVNKNLSLNFSVINLFDKAYAERADYSSFSGERFFPGIPLKWRFAINYKYN